MAFVETGVVPTGVATAVDAAAVGIEAGWTAAMVELERVSGGEEAHALLSFFFLHFYNFTEDDKSIYTINLRGREVIRAFKEGNSFPVACPHNAKW